MAAPICSGLGDSAATKLAAATIEHFTIQLYAIDKAIRETIDGDVELRGRRDLLLSVADIGETGGLTTTRTKLNSAAKLSNRTALPHFAWRQKAAWNG